jgi:DNA-binding FadR family transcriptional regulator
MDVPGEFSQQDINEFETAWWTRIAAATGNRILTRESRWWFELVREHPDRYASRYNIGTFSMRLQLYRYVLDCIRKREDVTAVYIDAVRPLLQRNRED